MTSGMGKAVGIVSPIYSRAPRHTTSGENSHHLVVASALRTYGDDYSRYCGGALDNVGARSVDPLLLL